MKFTSSDGKNPKIIINLGYILLWFILFRNEPDIIDKIIEILDKLKNLI